MQFNIWSPRSLPTLIWGHGETIVIYISPLIIGGKNSKLTFPEYWMKMVQITNWSFNPFCTWTWTLIINIKMCCEEGDCLFITNSFLLTGSVFVESRVDSRGDYSYLTDPGEVWPRKHNIGGHRTLPPGQENISHFKILQLNVFSKSYLHHQKWDFLQIRIHMHRKVMPASKSPEPGRETKGRFSTGVRQRYFPGKPHLSLRS